MFEITIFNIEKLVESGSHFSPTLLECVPILCTTLTGFDADNSIFVRGAWAETSNTKLQQS